MDPRPQRYPSDTRAERRLLAAAFTSAVIALVLYAGTVRGPFVYDDTFYVRDNLLIRDVANIGKLWTTPYPPDRPQFAMYRPVTATSYLVDYALAGPNAAAFHVTNLLIHALATFLAVLLVGRLGNSWHSALLAGLFFASHAVHTEAVAWIVGRAELLAAAGCFAASLAWIQFRRAGGWRAALAAAALYFIALGAKETAAPLPAALFVGDWLGLLSDPARRRADKGGGWQRARALARPYLAFALAFGAHMVLRVGASGRFVMHAESTAFVGESPATRVWSGFAALGTYARLLLLPTNLRLDYGDAKYSAFGVAVAAGFLAVSAIVGAAIVLRRRAPQASFWLAWFLFFLLPVCHLLVPIGAVLAERFVYIASLSFCALAGVGLGALAKAPRPFIRGGALAAMAGLAAAHSAATLIRNRDWLDPVRLFGREVERSPRSEKAYLNLGVSLWELGRAHKDEPTIARSDRILEAGIALRRDSARALTSDHAHLRFAYANHLVERGRWSESLTHYRYLAEVIERFPNFGATLGPDFFVWYGAALEGAGALEEARAQYQRALAVKPGWTIPLRNLGQLLARQGKANESIDFFRQVLGRDPSNAFANVSLGLQLAGLGRIQEAEATLQAFARHAGSSAEDAYLLGVLAARLGKNEEARARFRRALERDPRHEAAANALRALGHP